MSKSYKEKFRDARQEQRDSRKAKENLKRRAEKIQQRVREPYGLKQDLLSLEW